MAWTVCMGVRPLGTVSLRNRPMMSPSVDFTSSPTMMSEGRLAAEHQGSLDGVVVGDGQALYAGLDAAADYGLEGGG